MSGAASDPVELLRRLRARGGNGGMPAGFRAVDTNAARPRAAAEAQAEAPAADVGWPRERAETAAGLVAEGPDPARAGMVEVLPNGARVHRCRVCGRFASWGFGVALDRGREGIWFCFAHRGLAG
jgi:hypothetical protein